MSPLELFARVDEHAHRVSDVVRYYRDDLAAPRALVTLEGDEWPLLVPLDRLLAVRPARDRVMLPAETMGDLLTATATALEQLARRRGRGRRRVDELAAAARLEHALTAATEQLHALEPWELP